MADTLQNMPTGDDSALSVAGALPEDFTRAMAQTRHELRTPLNHIIGYSELLLDEAADMGLADLTGDLSKIRDAGRRLLGMLNSLLTPVALAGKFHAAAGTDATGADKTQEMTAVSPDSPAPERSTDIAKLAFAAILAPLPEATPIVPTANPLLVVDDDHDNRAVLGRLLTGMGYSVIGAPDGQAAISILSAYPCDAVFLDIMMPVMDGYTALMAIRADLNLRHVPVIMVSALDEIQVVARCIEAGAEDYLPKPFNPTLLKARLAAALEKKQHRDTERALYAELAIAHDKLQNAERLRDDMTRLLVQDLKLPLNSLVTSLEVSASLGDSGDSAQERREFLDLAIRGSHRVLTMVNGLLDIAKAEDGVLPITRTLYPPVPVAQLAALQVAELARTHKVTCELRDDVADVSPIYVDGGRVRQAIINLLENAIKHTPEGGRVTLSVEAASLESGAAVAFRVRDNGATIPADAAETLLNRFAQVEARQDGLRVSPGLALTFAKYVAQAHGGELRIETKTDGVGVDFLLILPRTAQTR